LLLSGGSVTAIVQGVVGVWQLQKQLALLWLLGSSVVEVV